MNIFNKMNINNNWVESKYKIKVNKKLIHKNSENNVKVIKTPSQKIKLSPKFTLYQRNSFSKKTKNLYNFDFDTNENFPKNYSQRTFTSKYLADDISYKKGNIIYDMQKNKYLKPIFDSKDFLEKILKCQIDKDDYNKSISITSPKLKESIFKINDIFKIKNQNKSNNYNFPLKFFRNNLNNSINKGNIKNVSKEHLSINNSFNNFKNIILKSDKVSKTCKNFHNNKINYYDTDLIKYQNNYNMCKYFENKNHKYYRKYSIKNNKTLNDKITAFCYILETFFLNIIKKNFRKFLNSIRNPKEKIYIINSETNSNSRKNTFYDTETIKNSNIEDIPIKMNTNAITNINFFNFFETNKIIENNVNKFDRDIIGNSKEKKEKKINKNELYDNNRNKKRILIFKKINNKDISDSPLVYNKKTNFIKSDIKKERKKSYFTINNKTFSFRNKDDNNIISKNRTKIFVLKNNLKEINIKQKKLLFIHSNYYVIKDIKYKKIYKYKYNIKKLAEFNKNLKYFRNTNFTINDNKTNIYIKIKINKKNKRYDNKNEKDKEYNKKNLINNLDKIKNKYNMNYISVDLKNNSNNNNNNNKHLLNKYYPVKKRENNSSNKYENRNIKINKILINCVKLLTKIITKIYKKRKFYIFKKALYDI